MCTNSSKSNTGRKIPPLQLRLSPGDWCSNSSGDWYSTSRSQSPVPLCRKLSVETSNCSSNNTIIKVIEIIEISSVLDGFTTKSTGELSSKPVIEPTSKKRRKNKKSRSASMNTVITTVSDRPLRRPSISCSKSLASCTSSEEDLVFYNDKVSSNRRQPEQPNSKLSLLCENVFGKQNKGSIGFVIAHQNNCL